jgi:glycosyltransferase involved in cell wall biosynthesis
MQINTPILSVVVPTKNRYETLSILTHTLLSWDNQNFELVIQDNSDDNADFQLLLTQYESDKRLVYQYTNDMLSAVENCDRGVKLARGKYLCFIGDDDGLVPQTIDFCFWLELNEIDAYYGNIGLYTWPDMEHAIAINNKMNGVLILPEYKGCFTFIDPIQELLKIMRSGGQSMANIPRLYQGIVSKKVLDLLFISCGTYFPGPVPDMSNAIALVPHLNKCIYSDVPFIISGQSKKSMSGRNAVRNHQGDIRKEKSIPKEAYNVWSREIPKYWSAPTIWAEAVMKSCVASNQLQYISEFNYAYLYASCLAFTKNKYFPNVWVAINARYKGIEKIYILLKILFYFIKITLKRTRIFIKKFSISNNDLFSSSIEGAIFLASEKIAKMKFNISK